MNLKRLTELRKQKKWSLQYTADQLGIAKSTYAGYETGYRRPSLEAIKVMANLFNTSVDYLIRRTDDPAFISEASIKHFTEQLELTDLSKVRTKLAIDGISLSESEVNQFIAYIRAKREIEDTHS